MQSKKTPFGIASFPKAAAAATQGVMKSSTRQRMAPTFANNFLSFRPLHSAKDRGLNPMKKQLVDKAQFGKASHQVTAHLPSVLYYLARRCGIGFREAEAMVEDQRIFIGPSTKELKLVKLRDDLCYQTEWAEFEENGIYGVHIAPLSGAEPVHGSKREVHREYWYLNRSAETTLAGITDPRSFRHNVQLTSGNDLGSLIVPKAATQRVGGFSIATDDLVLVSHLHHDHKLQPETAYKVSFGKGTPDGVVAQVAEELRSGCQEKDSGAHCTPAAMEGGFPCFTVSTKFFPQDLADKLVITGAVEKVTAVSYGGLKLPVGLAEKHSSLMGPDSVAEVLGLEKKLKVARVVQSLREVSVD